MTRPPHPARRRCAGTALALVLLILALSAAAGTTTLVSLGRGGVPAVTPAASSSPVVSGNGRFAVFLSDALNLAPVTSVTTHVFLSDLQTGTVELVSQSSGGVSANDSSFGIPAITPDGRFVAFSSRADNLAAGDHPLGHVYVRDRQLGTTVRADVGIDGAEPDNGADSPAISDDGRFVAFGSRSSNIVPGNENFDYNVFVTDRTAGTTRCVSVTPEGAPAGASTEPSISGDGRYVAFISLSPSLVNADTNGSQDAFVRDLLTGTTVRANTSAAGAQANGSIYHARISGNGRFVALESAPTNLIPNDTTSITDIYVKDLATGAVDKPSATAAGHADNTVEFPSISADGRFVTFMSWAENQLPPQSFGNRPKIFLRDRQTGALELVSVAADGTAGNQPSGFSSVSADGRVVVFDSGSTNLDPADVDGRFDIFARDRQANTTRRVSATSGGQPAERHAEFGPPTLSANGRYVGFWSDATNLVEGDTNDAPDVFVFDRESGGTERVNVSPSGEQSNANPLNSFDTIFNAGSRIGLSADGRYVAFASSADNLVAADTNQTADVFVKDRQSGQVERVSLSSAGIQGSSHSLWPVLTADGRYVAFVSAAPNLVAGDTNNQADVFLRDRATGTTERVNLASDGSQANGFADLGLVVSDDGRYVAFASLARNLVPGDGGAEGVYLRDRQAGTTERIDVSPAGAPSNGGFNPNIQMTGDGRFVFFTSGGSNLVAGDANQGTDVFVRDRQTGTTEIASLGLDGSQTANVRNSSFGISADGRYVSFVSVGFGQLPPSVYLRDRTASTTERLAEASPGSLGDSRLDATSSSADGKFVALWTQVAGLNSLGMAGTTDLVLLQRGAVLQPPSAPANLAVTATTATSVRIDWTDTSDNEDDFVIQRKTGTGEFETILTKPAGIQTATDQSASPNTTYTYRVGARNAAGTSFSGDAFVVTPPATPAAPAKLRATVKLPNAIVLTWTDRSDNEIDFEIQRKKGAGIFQRIGSAPANTLRFTDLGAVPGKTYTYRVRANAGGPALSSFSNNAQAMVPIVPAQVSVTPAPILSGNFGQLTVTLNARAPGGGITVNLSSTNSAAFPVPRSIFIPKGRSSARINVRAGRVRRYTSLEVRASANGYTAKAPVFVTSH